MTEQNPKINSQTKRKALIAVIVYEKGFFKILFLLIVVAIGSFALGFWYKGLENIAKICLTEKEYKILISSTDKPQNIKPQQKKTEENKTEKIEIVSAEIQLKNYLRSMYNRDWETVKKIYPTINQLLADKWLNGLGQQYHINKIKIINIIEETKISDTETKITAKVQYCRRNKHNHMPGHSGSICRAAQNRNNRQEREMQV